MECVALSLLTLPRLAILPAAQELQTALARVPPLDWLRILQRTQPHPQQQPQQVQPQQVQPQQVPPCVQLSQNHDTMLPSPPSAVPMLRKVASMLDGHAPLFESARGMLRARAQPLSGSYSESGYRPKAPRVTAIEKLILLDNFVDSVGATLGGMSELFQQALKAQHADSNSGIRSAPAVPAAAPTPAPQENEGTCDPKLIKQLSAHFLTSFTDLFCLHPRSCTSELSAYTRTTSSSTSSTTANLGSSVLTSKRSIDSVVPSEIPTPAPAPASVPASAPASPFISANPFISTTAPYQSDTGNVSGEDSCGALPLLLLYRAYKGDTLDRFAPSAEAAVGGGEGRAGGGGIESIIKGKGAEAENNRQDAEDTRQARSIAAIALTEDVLQSYQSASGLKKLEFRINAMQLWLLPEELEMYRNSSNCISSSAVYSTSSGNRADETRFSLDSTILRVPGRNLNGVASASNSSGGGSGGGGGAGLRSELGKPGYKTVVAGVRGGAAAFTRLLELLLGRDILPQLMRTALNAACAACAGCTASSSAPLVPTSTAVDDSGVDMPMDVTDGGGTEAETELVTGADCDAAPIAQSSSMASLINSTATLLLPMRVLDTISSVLVHFPLRHIEISVNEAGTSSSSFSSNSSCGPGSKIAMRKDQQPADAFSVLNVLAFSSPRDPLSARLWRFLTSNLTSNLPDTADDSSTGSSTGSSGRGGGASATTSHGRGSTMQLLNAIVDTDEKTLLRSNEFFLRLASARNITPATLLHYCHSLLFLFCAVFTHHLTAVDDEELLVDQRILKMVELKEMVRFLKRYLLRVYWLEPLFDVNSSFMPPVDLIDGIRGARSSSSSVGASFVYGKDFRGSYISSSSSFYSSPPSHERLLRLHCQAAATKLFAALCVRNERRSFLQPADWQWPALAPHDLVLEDESGSGSQDNSTTAMGPDGMIISVEGGSGAGGEGAAGAGGDWGAGGGGGGGSGGEDIAVKSSRAKAVLTFIPQVVPFPQRVQLMQDMIDRDKARFYSSGGGGGIMGSLGLSNVGAVRLKV